MVLSRAYRLYHRWYTSARAPQLVEFFFLMTSHKDRQHPFGEISLPLYSTSCGLPLFIKSSLVIQFFFSTNFLPRPFRRRRIYAAKPSATETHSSRPIHITRHKIMVGMTNFRVAAVWLVSYIISSTAYLVIYYNCLVFFFIFQR